MLLKFHTRFSYKSVDEDGYFEYGKKIVHPGEIVELEGADAEAALDYAEELEVTVKPPKKRGRPKKADQIEEEDQIEEGAPEPVEGELVN